MTIYTAQATSEKKTEKPQDVVEIAFPEELPVKKDIDDDDDAASETASTATIIVDRPRRRSHTTLCVLVVSLFIVAAGILGGIYLYRHLMHRKYVGYCSVRPGETDNGFAQERVELDLQFQEYEKIEVPKLYDYSAVRVIHDFSLNLSAIVDSENLRCYVMKLDRKHVQPPQNFFDLIQRMMAGEYDVNPTVVRENYRVIRPRIHDYSYVGVFITPECIEYNTFMLEKISGVERFRRSTSHTMNVLVFDGASRYLTIDDSF